MGDQDRARQPAQHRAQDPTGAAAVRRAVTESRSPAQTQARRRLSQRRPRSEGRAVSPDKDPARKRRIRSKAARLRRRSAPRTAADDQPVPPPRSHRPPRPSARPRSYRPPRPFPRQWHHRRPPSPVARRPTSHLPFRPASLPHHGRRAPSPVALPRDRRRYPSGAPHRFPRTPGTTRRTTRPCRPLPTPVPAVGRGTVRRPTLLEMLRRVRRGLRALPESDRHISD